MAQMANQDPESIMFNWSAPSRTAGGSGETTARRRWASWTATIPDIWILFILFSFLVQPAALAVAFRDIYRPRDVIEKDFSITVAAEVTRSAHTWRMHLLHTRAPKATHTFASADTSVMHALLHAHTHTRSKASSSAETLRSSCASLVSCRRLAGVKGQNEPPMRDAMRDLETPYTPPAHTPDLSVLQRNTLFTCELKVFHYIPAWLPWELWGRAPATWARETWQQLLIARHAAAHLGAC